MSKYQKEASILLSQWEKGTLASAPQWLASFIDHTLLKTDATEAQHIQLCQEAKQFQFATVCVYPKFLSLCKKELQGSNVKPIAVIGFPTGNENTSQKVEETSSAIAHGAEEIDMVIAVNLLKQRDLRAVFQDIQQVTIACKGKPLKVILETCLLNQEEKIMACALSKAAGAAFVKTSTGFSHSGATVEDIALMRSAVGEDMGVKASGGVRDLVTSMKMIAAGATRIGTSSGVAILSAATNSKGSY